MDDDSIDVKDESIDMGYLVTLPYTRAAAPGDLRQLCLFHRRRGRLGEAVQADHMKPTLKTPGTRRSKLKGDVLLSSFAFKFNLRRYTLASMEAPTLPVTACLAAALGRAV